MYASSPSPWSRGCFTVVLRLFYAVIVMSLQEAQTWSLSSQSQRHCSTQRPGAAPAGTTTLSTTSRLVERYWPRPEHLHTPYARPSGGGYPPPSVYVSMQASDSSHTGSNVGLKRGIGHHIGSQEGPISIPQGMATKQSTSHAAGGVLQSWDIREGNRIQ